MRSIHLHRAGWGMWFVVVGLLSQIAVGCDESRPRRTELFEQAERHYRRGEYDTALDQYQAFRERYPQSRLADTARLRIQTLTREVNSMLDRKDMPQPRYVGGNGDRSSADRSSDRSESESSTDPSESTSPTRPESSSQSSRDE